MVSLFKRKKQTIHVASVEIPVDWAICELDNEQIKQVDGVHVETPDFTFAFDAENDLIYRAMKSTARPKIVQVSSMQINQDSFTAQVELSEKELFEFAMRENLLVFELPTEWVIPAGVFMKAAKVKA